MPPLPETIPPTLAAVQANRVAANYVARKDDAASPFIRASKAYHECARSLWYDYRWASQGDSWSARMLRLFQTGHIEEERIVSDLTMAGLRVFDQQAEINIDGWISGHIDGKVTGVLEAPKSVHILECKSANDKSFAAIKAKRVARGKPEHWLQMQLYMMGTGLKRALYYLVNKDTDEEHVERVKFDAEAANRAVARLVGIAEAPRPPGKFRDDATKPPCLFCRHKAVCHQGAQARANCRTCLHSSPQPGGNWHCERWGHVLTPEEQAAGCEAHLYVPDLVAGEQIDADPVAGTVTYRLPSGETWIDGLGRGI
jgi:hypothetical protein